MITDYLRPKTIDEAVQLLGKKEPRSIPLGGGVHISRANQPENVIVVDLQDLGLSYSRLDDGVQRVGATTTLEALNQAEETPEGLRKAIRQEISSLNVRNMATLAGALCVARGNSPIAVCLMSMDAEMVWLPGEQRVFVGNWLPLRHPAPGLLMESIHWSTKVDLRYYGVGRSPADQPFLCLAATTWPSGRVRIVLGLETTTPVLVMDGKGADGLELAIENACSQYSNNQNYITETSLKIAQRLLNSGEAQQ